MILHRLYIKLRTIANSRPPDFIIGDDYCHRWWVIPRNRLFNIYLHHFLHSDDDRALHDHPWWNVSILLNGEYIEHTIAAGGVERRTRVRAGSLKFRRAKSAHRVELTITEDEYSIQEIPCWSLFITGPVVREWGFHCPRGWRPWREFLDQRDSGKIGRGCE